LKKTERGGCTSKEFTNNYYRRNKSKRIADCLSHKTKMSKLREI
jgi:hypothetical protein